MAIPQIIKDLASKVRNSKFGYEVRESIAQSMEETANVADETETRQDTLETQFQSVLDETTGKDIVSAPEISAARVSATGVQHSNLKDRLDEEYNKVASDLAHISTEKADVSYVDTKTQGVSLAYKESYATLTDLQTAYPSGDSYNHAVLADGMIYTYANSTWTNTQIQANGTGIADNSITPEKTNGEIPNTRGSYNLFVKENAVTGKYINKTTGVETVHASYGYISLTVTPGEFLFVLNNIGTNQEGAYFDGLGTYISNLFTGVNYALNTSKNKYALKIPDNAVTIKLNFLMTEIDNIIIFQDATKVHTSNTIEEKWLNANAIKRSDTPFVENIKSRVDSSAILDFMYINQSGALAASTTYNLFGPFPVTPGEKYLVENWLPDTTLPSALGSRGVFLDSNFKFISALPTIDSYSPEYAVPENAAYMTLLFDAALKSSLSVRRTYTPNTEILISQNSIFPPIVETTQKVIGETGKTIKVVACVIRNSGSGWQFINDAGHAPLNCASVSNDNSKITITYNFTAKKVVSFVACPDETMASDFMSMGASVGVDTALINLYQNKSMGGYIYYDGANWVFNSAEGVSGVSFSNGVLTITHSAITGIKGSVECRTGALLANLGSLGTTTTEVYFRDYTGALATSPTTDMKIYFERDSSNLVLSPNNYINSNGNIWCLGVFEI